MNFPLTKYFKPIVPSLLFVASLLLVKQLRFAQLLADLYDKNKNPIGRARTNFLNQNSLKFGRTTLFIKIKHWSSNTNHEFLNL